MIQIRTSEIDAAVLFFATTEAKVDQRSAKPTSNAVVERIFTQEFLRVVRPMGVDVGRALFVAKHAARIAQRLDRKAIQKLARRNGIQLEAIEARSKK